MKNHLFAIPPFSCRDMLTYDITIDVIGERRKVLSLAYLSMIYFILGNM